MAPAASRRRISTGAWTISRRARARDPDRVPTPRPGAAAQKLQHVVPATPLLVQGISRLQHEPHGWSLLLAAGEVGVSVLVVGAFLRQVRAGAPHPRTGLRRRPREPRRRLGRMLIGAMLGVEVWAHWYESGHIKRPTVVMAVGIFIVGLLHGKIAARAGRRQALKDRRRRARRWRPAVPELHRHLGRARGGRDRAGASAPGPQGRQGAHAELRRHAQRRRRARGPAGREAAHARDSGARGGRYRRRHCPGVVARRCGPPHVSKAVMSITRERSHAARSDDAIRRQPSSVAP